MRLLLAALAATAHAQNAKLVIVAQFKNEAESLPQWLDHYLTDEGVSTMLLVNDNSTDSWQKAVESYGSRVRVRSGHAHRQVENYNIWLSTLRREFADDRSQQLRGHLSQATAFRRSQGVAAQNDARGAARSWRE